MTKRKKVCLREREVKKGGGGAMARERKRQSGRLCACVEEKDIYRGSEYEGEKERRKGKEKVLCSLIINVDPRSAPIYFPRVASGLQGYLAHKKTPPPT